VRRAGRSGGACRRAGSVGPELSDRGHYELPETLARHAPAGGPYTPDELGEVCRRGGEGLGKADAALGEFRSAAEMVSLWKGLDLPAWKAPYALRAARLGYLSGFGETLVRGDLDEDTASRAAAARWGKRGQERLDALRKRESTG
jgi:hypothetical protein